MTKKTSNIEAKWQKFWYESNVYSWNEEEPRCNNYVIDTPPPTVSGALHMGHVFSYTQTDFIARYQRMLGNNVFYPMGWDNNGLPTERLVEKIKGVKASSIPKHDFAFMCEEIIEESTEKFKDLWKSLGISIDWAQEYHTMSKRSQRLSQLSFIDLYNKGYIYRKSAPTFWDTIDRTALAQIDTEDKERSGIMYDIQFGLREEENSSSNQHALPVISTTRPELLPACSALFYNPEDERYTHFEGKTAVVPLFDVEIPIIADPDVNMEKGSGMVMCSTFGDMQDIIWWRKHNLPLKSCICENGRMQNAGSLTDLKIKEARGKVVQELQNAGKILKEVEVTQHIKCAERSGAPLEIIVTDQWYIDVLSRREEILDMGSQCQWHPHHMKVRFDNWVNGLNQDWCISRQRFFGVSFPVWYSKREGEEGKVLLPDISSLPVDPLRDLPSGYSRDEVIADSDVMDTWATSALTPQLSSCGITKEFSIDRAKHEKLYPFDLRPQGHEIIRTWTFATIVKSLYHENVIPWKDIVLSGWCLASDKKKMSKSKGNASYLPETVVSEFGADAVRYWASNVKLGADIIYSEDAFKIGNKLVKKLTNALKFCKGHFAKMQHVPSSPRKDVSSGVICEFFDIWLLDGLYHVVERVGASFDKYEYSSARAHIDDFFWKIFCDNYLELVKSRVYNNCNEASGQSAIITLYHAMDTILRLFAPFIPHVTEELFQDLQQELYDVRMRLSAQGSDGADDSNNADADEYCSIESEDKGGAGKIGAVISIHRRGMWPDASQQSQCGIDIVENAEIGIELIALLRKVKSERSLSMVAAVKKVEIHNAADIVISQSVLSDVQAAMKVENMIVTARYKDEDELAEMLVSHPSYALSESKRIAINVMHEE